MFKSIGIANVQAHRETSIDLSEGVNVLTGQSDSGKTTILRACDWLFNNRPSGEVYRNWDTDTTEPMAVEIVTKEGSTIAINREKGKNSYVLSDKNGKEMTFNAIRMDVPSEIKEALNIAPYNVQSQHQKYFLLQDTPGEVARTLNDLTGLSIIDSAFKRADTDIRRIRNNIDESRGERDNFAIQLKSYDNLESIHDLIKEIEELEEEQAETSSAILKINKTITDIKSNKEKMAELQSTIEVDAEVNVVMELIREYETTNIKKDRISELLGSLSKVREDLDQDKSWLGMELLCLDLLGLLDQYSEIEKQKVNLESMIRQLSESSEKRKKANELVAEVTKKYVTLLAKEGVCPTCGTELSTPMLKELQERL